MSVDKILIRRGFYNQEMEYYDNMEEVISLPYYHQIVYLMCSNCNLIRLPEKLPRMLRGLYCENNFLTKLPKLPNDLTELVCSNNQLTKLPNLNVFIDNLILKFQN